MKIVLSLLVLVGLFAWAEEKPEWVYQDKTIQGWTVHINEKLMRENGPATLKVLDLLDGQLAEIIKLVPAPAVVELKKVPLYFNPEYPKVRPTAEYHPGAGWLKDNGRNPAMAKGVEFTDIRNYEAEMKRMPLFVLHELAHAYHDRVFGFDQAEIVACYKKAKASGSYDKVERFHGDPKRPNTFEKAYAMTNQMEYFAETSEAFFGRNDFFPFTKGELEKHDPEMFKLLEKVWNHPENGKGAGK